MLHPRLRRACLMLALSLFSCLTVTAQTATALREQADSLYALQQYNDALTVALSGLSRLNGGGCPRT